MFYQAVNADMRTVKEIIFGIITDDLDMFKRRVLYKSPDPSTHIYSMLS